ncbi:hypothetical protein DEU56DRAFT_764563 [Suillus clintonianus]|uniref:uncharacterized protein n=1 Tax=Suillus clintonianus TaxID=1904413 RepID=UPI001B87EBE8|nr:uncharacterized protein DEU56DRAFT_764563 [Suillus clintonianus]KAG2157423.1 hypothetical protein DEU56DRAFT_764563 [Suillus clintonianus]
MGNTSSSSTRGHHDDTVDYGHLAPQGVYTGPNDWNHGIVTQFIVDRKLAPFYRPLEDYNENWDDEQIMSARRVLPDSDSGHSDTTPTRVDSRDCSKPANQSKRPVALKEPSRCPEAAVYRGAVECPICFLYYPPNMNHSRCCDQAICTECFVQIKRTEPTATHLVSEPAACPYCVQENFGVVYTPPPWRTGIGSDGTSPPVWAETSKASQQNLSSAAHKRRRKSFGHDSPEVVTTDQIRPDWEAKLAAVRAAVTRRANRRIIMRQVGDRLIPVGVTSGRVHPLPTGDGQDGGEVDPGATRRSRRHRNNGQPDISQLLGQMGLGGQDLEELMVMEAMRLSLMEHEEQQRKEEEKRKKEAAAAASGGHIEGDTPGRSSEDQTTTNTVGNDASNSLSAARSLESGEATAEANHGGSRAMTPVAGQPTSSSHSQTPVDTSATRSDGTISISAQPRCMTPGASFPMVGDGIIDSTASAVPNGVVKLSSQNASMYIDNMKPSTGTPGAASISSSISSPNTPGQSSYDALPSSPESLMEEPLLNTDLVSVTAAAKPAGS